MYWYITRTMSIQSEADLFTHNLYAHTGCKIISRYSSVMTNLSAVKRCTITRCSYWCFATPMRRIGECSWTLAGLTLPLYVDIMIYDRLIVPDRKLLLTLWLHNNTKLYTCLLWLHLYLCASLALAVTVTVCDCVCVVHKSNVNEWQE